MVKRLCTMGNVDFAQFFNSVIQVRSSEKFHFREVPLEKHMDSYAILEDLL